MNKNAHLTPSLEDYLETIYLLHKGSQRVRVRDISKQRSVKAASVTPALKRLAEMGFLQYEQREIIQLTEEGKAAARRVYARHQLLFQFFHDVLGMDKESAQTEACGLEHALSDQGMSRLVDLFEAFAAYSTNGKTTLETLKRVLVKSLPLPDSQRTGSDGSPFPKHDIAQDQSLFSVADNTDVVVVQLNAAGRMRQTLIDTGLVPNVVLRKLATDSEQNRVVIELYHHTVVIETRQAQAVMVRLRDRPEQGLRSAATLPQS